MGIPKACNTYYPDELDLFGRFTKDLLSIVNETMVNEGEYFQQFIMIASVKPRRMYKQPAFLGCSGSNFRMKWL